jgi:hypothetical protein
MMNKQPLKVALTFLSVGAVILMVLLLLSQSLYGQRILEGGPTEYPKCLTSNVTHTFCEYIVFANQTVVENPHNKSMVQLSGKLLDQVDLSFLWNHLN